MLNPRKANIGAAGSVFALFPGPGVTSDRWGRAKLWTEYTRTPSAVPMTHRVDVMLLMKLLEVKRNERGRS